MQGGLSEDKIERKTLSDSYKTFIKKIQALYYEKIVIFLKKKVINKL